MTIKGTMALFVVLVGLMACQKDEDKEDELDELPLELVLNETYSDNSSNWYTVNDNEAKIDVNNGYYNIELKRDSFFYYTYLNTNFNTRNRFIIETEIVTVSTQSNSGFGLLWGVSGTKERDFFLLDAAGNLYIGHRRNFVDKFGLQGYTSGYVDLTKPTRLKVERYKEDVYYYINNKLVFHEPFQHFGNQNVGYYMENKTAIGVDWIQVYD